MTPIVSTGLVQFDLSSEIKAMGYECSYSIEDPPKEFYVQVRAGEMDMRVFIIAENYGYHFKDKVALTRPNKRRNTDKFNVQLVLEYDPSIKAGRYRKIDQQKRLS